MTLARFIDLLASLDYKPAVAVLANPQDARSLDACQARYERAGGTPDADELAFNGAWSEKHGWAA